MGEMRILGKEGDLKQIWDSANAEEVEVARDLFEKMTKKGFTAFRVGSKGAKTTIMETFDPDAEKMILVPKVVGG